MSKIYSNQSINFLFMEEKSRNSKLKKSKAFIDYSKTIDDVDENFQDYNTTKNRRVF